VLNGNVLIVVVQMLAVAGLFVVVYHVVILEKVLYIMVLLDQLKANIKKLKHKAAIQ
jgi:hypothetical protein